MLSTDLIISQSKNWIKEFVIKYDFCPFAKSVFVNQSIRFTVDLSDETDKGMEHLLVEIKVLDKQPAIKTSIIIYPHQFTDFGHYLDFHATANALLENLNYDGIYQLATFHPEFRFAGSHDHDAANYTNRSPYPMIHILREDIVEEALHSYENPEEIPTRNIIVARKLGHEKVKSIRKACFDLN